MSGIGWVVANLSMKQGGVRDWLFCWIVDVSNLSNGKRSVVWCNRITLVTLCQSKRCIMRGNWVYFLWMADNCCVACLIHCKSSLGNILSRVGYFSMVDNRRIVGWNRVLCLVWSLHSGIGNIICLSMINHWGVMRANWIGWIVILDMSGHWLNFRLCFVLNLNLNRVNLIKLSAIL